MDAKVTDLPAKSMPEVALGFPQGTSGWRGARGEPSLSNMFGSVRTAKSGSFWRKLLAFLGPGYLVAVGYMDPGNWATSLAGLQVRLCAADGRAAVEPDGDLAAIVVHAAGRRRRP